MLSPKALLCFNSLAIVVGDIYNVVRYLDYKSRYPHSRVSFGARICKGSTIGKCVNIGRNSTISSSIMADSVTISDNCSISNTILDENSFVYQGSSLNKVEVGRFSYVGISSAINKTKLGSFCSLGPYLLCGGGDHPTSFISTNPIFYSTLKQCGTSFTGRDYYKEWKEISIGHDVWIGARVFIRDGVKIGNGVIVGAGSVVVNDVPDYAIVGGVPARIIDFRFSPELIKKLLEIEWWNWSRARLQKAQALFAQEDVNAFLEWAYRESD